ncbi:MAG: PD40 domain-containing protein [Planctomycetes bacterium]|nr:PD40 domain-containing protein [Planctomycetota bacterium]
MRIADRGFLVEVRASAMSVTSCSMRLLCAFALWSAAGGALVAADDEVVEPVGFVAAVGFQSAVVSEDGSFTIRNVPVFPARLAGNIPGPLAPYRLRVASTLGASGTSDVFTLVMPAPNAPRIVIEPPELDWNFATQIPQRLRLEAPVDELNYGRLVRLRLVRIRDDIESDITLSPETIWLSTNNGLATVAPFGEVRSQVRTTPGKVFITALNQGMVATVALDVIANLDPSSRDTDGDGMPDEWERLYRLNPNDPTDADGDSDGDGLANADEFLRGGNPLRTDTDADGLRDDVDGQPGVPESIPPVVTIQSPLPGALHRASDMVVVRALATDNAVVRVAEVRVNGVMAGTPASSTEISLAVRLPAEPGTARVVVTARDVAGNVGSAEVDVEIVDGGTNTPPAVDAGSDVVASAGARSATLWGVVADDGNPDPPAALSLLWSIVAAEGDASFADAAALSPTITVSAPGIYRVRLTASDGQYSSWDEATITFPAQNQFPAPTDRIHLVDVAADRVPNGAFQRLLSTSDDGRYVLTMTTSSNFPGASRSPSVKTMLWDRATGACRIVRHSTPTNVYTVRDAAMSGDGRTIAVVFSDLYNVNSLRTVDVATGEVATILEFDVNTRSMAAPTVSFDGQWFAFTTDAALVPQDQNTWPNEQDVYRISRTAKVPLLVSRGAAATTANAASDQPAISGDGRFIAYRTTASLVSQDTNGVSDIYCRDLSTDVAMLVSSAIAGQAANAASFAPVIDATGRRVAFTSSASNLIAADANAVNDVFWRDIVAGVTRRSSRSATGGDANAASADPRISADGRTVAFHSRATNLVVPASPAMDAMFATRIDDDAADGPVVQVARDAPMLLGSTDIRIALSGDGRWAMSFVRPANGTDYGHTVAVTDLLGNIASASLTGPPDLPRAGTGSAEDVAPAVSPDGRYVGFASVAPDLVLPRTNGRQHVFVYDRVSGEMDRVSRTSGGVEATGDSGRVAITPNGRFVAFASSATNLVGGDSNARMDVFVHDRVLDTTRRVSVGAAGVQANGDSDMPSISGDGRYVLFQSAATNLVAGDANASVDVFRHDLLDEVTIRVSKPMGGIGGSGDSRLNQPNRCLSADGRFAVFSSIAGILPGVSGLGHIYRHDVDLDATVLVSLSSTGALGNERSYTAAITADGLRVAFQSSASNLSAADTNSTSDIFLRDIAAGQTQIVSLRPTGGSDNANSFSPSVSDDGRFVTFVSAGTGDTGLQNVYVRDTLLQMTTRVSPPNGTSQGHSNAGSISADGSWTMFVSYGELAPATQSGYHVYAIPTPRLPDAGPDLVVRFDLVAALVGRIPQLYVGVWTVVSGPGNGSFANQSAPQTTFSATVPGTYILRLTASNGEQSASDDVTVTILENAPSGSG